MGKKKLLSMHPVEVCSGLDSSPNSSVSSSWSQSSNLMKLFILNFRRKCVGTAGVFEAFFS